MIRSFRYPLKPTKAQEAILESWLGRCQRLYNAALEQRITAWRMSGKGVSLYDQFKELTELRRCDRDYAETPCDILRDPLRRLDRAYKAFFRRVKAGEKPGFPRFRSRDRYDALAFPAGTGDRHPSRGSVFVPLLGLVKFHEYREREGEIKEVRIKRTAKRWWVVFVCDIGAAPEKREINLDRIVGIDLGLYSFVTLSNGEKVENPRYFRKGQDVIARRSRALQTKKKGSASWCRAKRLLGRAHEHVRNQRLDFARKLAAILFSRFDVVVHEDLNVQEMASSQDKGKGLRKSIHDAAWSCFISVLVSKAECAGTYTIGVDPRGTTQRCSGCDKVVRKDLGDRIHECVCGLRIDRDWNAALNIVALGKSVVRQIRSAAEVLN